MFCCLCGIRALLSWYNGRGLVPLETLSKPCIAAIICESWFLQAALFAKEGVTKIRLTGGEPTIRKDIVQLTAELAAIPGVEAVGITTNGIALQRKLSALKANGTASIWGISHRNDPAAIACD